MHTETLDFTPVNLQSKNADAMNLLNKPTRFFFLIFAFFSNSCLIYMLEGANDPASLVFTIIMYAQAVQLVVITYLIFGNWKNFSWGPALALTLAYITLVAFPIAITILSGIFWAKVN
jgi:hypothetical protein